MCILVIFCLQNFYIYQYSWYLLMPYVYICNLLGIHWFFMKQFFLLNFCYFFIRIYNIYSKILIKNNILYVNPYTIRSYAVLNFKFQLLTKYRLFFNLLYIYFFCQLSTIYYYFTQSFNSFYFLNIWYLNTLYID